MYKLKKGYEEFSIVEGPFAGKTFRRGESYAEVPPQEMRRFEEVNRSPAKGNTAAVANAAAEKESTKITRKFGKY
jgi:hypothetical protein